MWCFLWPNTVSRCVVYITYLGITIQSLTFPLSRYSYIPTLQMSKCRHKEAKVLSQGHAASGWQSWIRTSAGQLLPFVVVHMRGQRNAKHQKKDCYTQLFGLK